MTEAAIGFVSAAVAVAVSHPADTLSRQLQVTSRQKFNTSSLLSGQGVRQLFKGIGPALVTQPTYWAICFPIYGKLKEITAPTEAYRLHRFLVDMANGFSAGAVATTVTNPLWVLRQRMQTEHTKGRTSVSYRTLISEAYAERGVLTFFRGTGITLVKNVQMAFLLPMFERLKEYEGWRSTGLPAPMIAGISGAVAKVVSSTAVYPLDVIRTNLRVTVGKNVTFRSVASELVFERPGGIANLFRGIGWYWLSAGGAFAVLMSTQSVLRSLMAA